MNHLNKHYGLNARTLEEYLDEENKKAQVRKRLDRIGLFLMIMAGLLGLFYMLTSTAKRSKAKSSTEKLTHLANKNSGQSVQALAVASRQSDPIVSEKAVKMVSMEGTPKVGQALAFHIDNLDPDAEYRLILGDGHKRVVNQSKLHYTYAQAGTYELQLEVTYQGETQMAYREVLLIE